VFVARTPSSRVDRLVRFVTGKKRFTCLRCGWTALRDWQQSPRFTPTPKLKSARKSSPILVHSQPRDEADLTS
jgi:hypothetical protein